VTPAPRFGIVLLFNLPWLLTPLAMIARMWRDHPFTEPAPEPASASAPAEAAA